MKIITEKKTTINGKSFPKNTIIEVARILGKKLIEKGTAVQYFQTMPMVEKFEPKNKTIVTNDEGENAPSLF